MGIGAIVWLLFMAAAASGLGGYLAAAWRRSSGRLSREGRSGSCRHGSGQDGGSGRSPAASLAEKANPTDYFADMLFRGSRPAEPGTDPAVTRNESPSILTNALQQGELSAGDKTYLAQLVARRTGLSQSEAEQRVTQVSTAAKSAADAAEMEARAAAEAARKTGLYLARWVFVSLLLGAFCASLAATIGGRQRDAWAAAR